MPLPQTRQKENGRDGPGPGLRRMRIPSQVRFMTRQCQCSSDGCAYNRQEEAASSLRRMRLKRHHKIDTVTMVVLQAADPGACQLPVVPVGKTESTSDSESTFSLLFCVD